MQSESPDIVRTDYFENKTMRYNDNRKVRITKKEILYEMKRTVVAKNRVRRKNLSVRIVR